MNDRVHDWHVRARTWLSDRLPPVGVAAGLRRWLRTPTVRMRAGHRLTLDLDSDEQRGAFVNREYEPSSVRACVALLPADGVALDIGAHVGMYACALGMHVRSGGGRVYAFEPVPSNFARLAHNVEQNDLGQTVFLERAALGRTAGSLELRLVPGAATGNAVGDNMLTTRNREEMASAAWPRATAPLRVLDEWAAGRSLRRCDLIKIDVEGAELEVFAGARALLERWRPAILAEFNPYWMSCIGQAFSDVRSFFAPWGYRFHREVDGRFRALTPALEARSGEVPSYLLLPPGRALPESRAG